MPTRYRFLGLPCVELEAAAAVPLGGSRPMQLLAHLAVSGTWQARDHVAHLFWPERPDKIARSNLRNLLFKVPLAAPFAPIESTEHALRLKAPSDLDDFEAAVQRQDWEAVARVGAHELLQGFESSASEPYVQWLRAEREARLSQWTQAVAALLGEALRPLEQREVLAQAWALRCPFDENAVQARISLAYERRQAAVAVKIYRAFETRLRDELGVRPSVDLERFALQAPQPSVAGEPAPASADRAQADRAPAPRPPSPARPSMTGRRLELRQLAALLKGGATQLVTLTGPGGVGKSTLLAALHRLWVDGGGTDTFLVDVSDAPNAKAAILAIASALNVTVPQGMAEEEALADALGERGWVLMIDGAEQAGLAAPLALLIERCAQTRWLIASRQRLQLDHEQLLVLDGFPLPDADEADAELLSANDGVRFLADTMAKAGRPVDMARESATMAAIVRAVEGLPLALKLLGKLTHLFTLAQLLDSVQQPGQGAKPGEAVELTELLPSLLASFQRSWTSLSPQEQAVLARLAVFPAEFEIAAGRWVAQTELPLLTSLVDRSLLRATGTGRLSMHAAIRSCVLSVCPQPSADAVPDYLAYFAQRLRALASLAKTKTVRPLQQFLDDQRAHVDRVWALALERRDHAVLLSLQESVWFMDDGSSTARDFSARCSEAEHQLRDEPAVPPALRAMLLAGMAKDVFYQARWPLALEHAGHALRQAQRARHHPSTASALTTLSLVRAYLGDATPAEMLIAKLETLLTRVGEQDGLLAMGGHFCRAMLAIERRSLEPALEHYERASNIARKFDDPDSELICLMSMAVSYYSFGMPGLAIPFEDRALAVGAQRKADPALVATYLCVIAHCNVDSGNTARAQAHMQRADALICSYPQTPALLMKVRLGHAAVFTAQGQLVAARVHLCEILDAIGRDDSSVVSGTAFVVVARWFQSAGERQASVDMLRAVLATSVSGENFRLAKAMLHELGEELPDPGAPADGRSKICIAAALARQRMVELALPAQRGISMDRAEAQHMGAARTASPV